MARVIILYGTTEGQTASISEYIAEVVRDHGGNEAETLDVKELPNGFALEAYEVFRALDERQGMVEKFVDETGWRPDMVGIFGGALRYTQYGFVKRHLMKKISKDKGSADLDTSRDYEYTDWNDVRHFAEEFLQQGLLAEP